VRILLVSPTLRSISWEGLTSDPYIQQAQAEIKTFGYIKNKLLVGSIGWFWERNLKKLGHDVEVFVNRESKILNYKRRISHPNLHKIFIKLKANSSLLTKLDTNIINYALVKKALYFKPDIILVTEGENIYPETFQKIKSKLDVKIGLRLGANPFYFQYIGKGIVRNLPNYDVIFTNKKYLIPELIKAGAKRVRYYSLRCDPEFHRSVNSESERKLDVCFIGSRYSLREKYLKAVAELALKVGFSFKFWGFDWSKEETDKSLYRYYQGITFGEEMVKIYSSSKIALNIEHSIDRSGGNMRLFEIPACGAMQIVNEKEEIENLFKRGEEIVMFKDTRELKEKILYYLRNDEIRSKIAQAGQARAHREHNYERGLKYIIEALLEE
jgi:spore maturation protein CgeB